MAVVLRLVVVVTEDDGVEAVLLRLSVEEAEVVLDLLEVVAMVE